jgi:iron complex outermembrane recepter protein
VEARNVDAKTHGAEADVTVQLGSTLSMTATAAWVRSTNDTDDVPLAQTPPLEGTLSLDHDNGRLVQRPAVARRPAPGPDPPGLRHDLQPGHRRDAGLCGALGLRRAQAHRAADGHGRVDNLLDRAYSEHIQRGSAELGASTQRIFEPGRTLWLRIYAEF